MRVPRRGALCVLAMLALAVWHWWFAYSPRLRPDVPSGPEASLLDAPWAETAAWVPYPHQNLRALERRSGLPPEAARDVLVLAGVDAPRLPAFGGMLSPPARSLAVATGADGELAVAVRVYPAFAAFARLAGRLAENPWLRGGEVLWNDRPVKVRWRGTLWTAGSPSLPVLHQPSPRDSAAALLVASARRPSAPLPAGRFGLRIENGDMVLRTDGKMAESGPGAVTPGAVPEEYLDARELDKTEALLLLIATGAGGGDSRRLGPGMAGDSVASQAMIFFGQDPADLAELPRASIVYRGDKRWSLPAEGLLEMAGRRPASAGFETWSMVATDRAALGATRSLAASLGRRLEAAEKGLLELDLWLRLGPAAIEMSRVRRGLERAPLLPRRRLRRWRAAERLLAGLALEHSALRLVVTRPDGLVLRISRLPEGRQTAETSSPATAD